MRYLLTTFLVVMSASTSLAEETLCSRGERVVFSCHVKRKLVSLCRKGGEPKRMAYRFGSIDKVKLTYADSSRNSFYQHTVPMYGGGMTYVGFFIGDYEYRIYSSVTRTDAGEGEETIPVFEDGIIILRGGKEIKKLVCDDGGEGFRESIDWLPREE